MDSDHKPFLKEYNWLTYALSAGLLEVNENQVKPYLNIM